VAFTVVWPAAFVVAGAVRVALAPLPGAAKTTLAPETALPSESLTVTRSGLANVVRTVALCDPPLVALIEAGAPAVFVSENVAEWPFTVAVTV
jgi:hypothetical protein